jgi:hypothetical protein
MNRRANATKKLVPSGTEAQLTDAVAINDVHDSRGRRLRPSNK